MSTNIPSHHEPARALFANPFESALAAQGPTDLQGIGQVRQRGATMAGQKERITVSTPWGVASAEGRGAICVVRESPKQMARAFHMKTMQ